MYIGLVTNVISKYVFGRKQATTVYPRQIKNYNTETMITKYKKKIISIIDYGITFIPTRILSSLTNLSLHVTSWFQKDKVMKKIS